MPNAHSHAFQRGLRGRAERPGPAGGNDDFWTWRTEMFHLAETLDPDSMRAVGARVLPGNGRLRVRGRRRISLRPPPARRHSVRRAERDGAGRRRRGRRGRPSDRAASGGVSPRRLGRRGPPARAGSTALLRSGCGGVPVPSGRAPRVGVSDGRASTWGSPPTASGRSLRAGSRRSPSTLSATGSSVMSTPTSSGASSRSVRPSTAARRSSCLSEPGSSARTRA